MKPNELNQISRAELEALLLTPGRFAARPCRLCGESFHPTREWQHFCCAEHQKVWNKNETKILLARAAERIRHLEAEVDFLRSELAKSAGRKNISETP